MNQSIKELNASFQVSSISKYAYLSVVPFSSIGLIANLTVLYILISDKYFSKTTYSLIRMTVISDIISNLSSIIGYILMTMSDMNYGIGTVFCRLIAFIIVSTYGLSIMSLCMISLDRYFAIVKPLSPFYRSHKKNIVIIGQIMSWIIVIATASPLAAIVDAYHDDTTFCDLPEITRTTSAYIYISSIILYYVPSLTLISVYFKIMQHQRVYVQPGQINNRQIERNQIKKRRLIKTLIIITSIYMITTWPYVATGLGIATTHKSLRQIREINLVFYTLAIVSFMATIAISAINPFIYLIFDYNIRKKLVVMARLHILRTDYSVNRMISSRTTNDLILPDVNY